MSNKVDIINLAKSKLEAFSNEIDRVAHSEFPYDFSKEALEIFQARIDKQLSILNGIGENSDLKAKQSVAKNACTIIEEWLPIVGFLLRSTNVRNAFEAHGPLLRFTQQILNNDVKLVLSSEWDFSPYTYRAVPDLHNFVLIGLPASESSNPLLIPLAGHELGHTVWVVKNKNSVYLPKLELDILNHIQRDATEFSNQYNVTSTDPSQDIFAYQKLEEAKESAIMQAEETFCDFVGLYLFGEAFMHAFTYLLAPGSGFRDPYYPPLDVRVKNIQQAALKYGYSVPSGFTQVFVTHTRPNDLMQMLADEALQELTPTLIDDVEKLLQLRGISKPSTDQSKIIHEQAFQEFIVPFEKPATLAEIINAGWLAWHDTDLWKHHPEIDNKKAVLSDLLLKNFELLEVNHRIGR